jgi:hypothetical protein
MLTIFPSEIQVKFFQFLDIPSLGTVSQVCKDWELIQKSDEIWKAVSLNYLDDDKLPITLNSWKERCKIIQNWMRGKAQVEAFTKCYKSSGKIYEFGFIEDEVIEVRPNLNLSYEVFSVFPCMPQQPPRPLNLADLLVGEPICTALFKNHWAALDSNGAVLCCDIITGEGVKFTDWEETAQINEGHICISQDEIITEALNELKIWNRKSGLVTAKISVDKSMGKVWGVYNSNRHIICETQLDTYPGTYHQIFAIHKQDKTSQILTKTKFVQTSAAGPYVAILGENNELSIYEENQEALELVYTIKEFKHLSDLKSGVLHFYHNWLFVFLRCELNVVNVNSGQIFCRMNVGKEFRTKVSVNSSKLCVRAFEDFSNLQWIYSYKLYDLEKSPRPASELYDLEKSPRPAASGSILDNCIVQ